MNDYIRLCPSCGAENGADVMRCSCGAMLFGVDLVRADAVTRHSPEGSEAPAAPALSANVAQCPYDDCGQANPPGSTQCLYCNRPLAGGTPLLAGDGLLALPSALRERYRIARTLPANGAEAEILLVEAIDGGSPLIAKIYRQGIRPNPDVQARLARIPPRHRVNLLETGLSDGYAYELMEYCAGGSLRERIGSRWPAEAFAPIVRELATAISAVHAAGLVHRDLKPDNVLVRSKQPLQLVLTDFGIASLLDATQRFTGAARTLPYASPESLSGVINGKADYWALGMLLLEAALGRHPFAGLSDAVILHHLTTRSIDLGEIADANLRKLLRGLLLRDPQQRWGSNEIERWLAGDMLLAEPADQGNAEGYVEPYCVGSERCRSPEQLAIALSRDWAAGVADLANGQMLRWFRDIQKDQNTVRLLLEMKHDQVLHVDVQLVRMLLHCAPGLPPVWRGENIELPAVLSRANLALRGDADAARWLDALYQHRVLELYANAGNPQAAELQQRWVAAADSFAEAWRAQMEFIRKQTPERRPGEVVLYDDVVFGRSGPQRPTLLALHPRLLAMAYDPKWSERLRQRLIAEMVTLAVHAPWLKDIGELETMNAPALLAFEALLPEARTAAEHNRKQESDRRTENDEQVAQLLAAATACLPRLQDAAQRSLVSQAACNELGNELEVFHDLLAQIRAQAPPAQLLQTVRTKFTRAEPIAANIRKSLHALLERRTANAGWFGLRMITFQALAVWIIPEIVGNRALPYLLGAVIAIAAWRLLPNVLTRRKISALADDLARTIQR